MIERRTRRSDRPSEALALQLQSCAERAGLQAVIVSDYDGFLVGASPWSREDSEELAALLPLLARDGRFAGILLGEASIGWAVQVETFKSEDERLFICAVGKIGPGVADEISTAVAGVSRILH
jgi:hypothetical protein